MTESLRESFEKWAVKHLGDERFLIRDKRQPDKYDAYLVDHLWAGYRAGAAAMLADQMEDAMMEAVGEGRAEIAGHNEQGRALFRFKDEAVERGEKP